MILQYIEENIVLTILTKILDPSHFYKLSKVSNITNLIHSDDNGKITGALVDLFEKDIGGYSFKLLFKDDADYETFLKSLYDEIRSSMGRFMNNNKVNIHEVFELIKRQIANSAAFFTSDNTKTAEKLISQTLNPYHHFYDSHSNIIKGAGIGTASLIGIPHVVKNVGDIYSSSNVEEYPTFSLPATNNILPSIVNGAALLGGAYATYKYLKNKRDTQRIVP